MQQEITCLVVAMRRQRNIRIHKMILECLEERWSKLESTKGFFSHHKALTRIPFYSVEI